MCPLYNASDSSIRVTDTTLIQRIGIAKDDSSLIYYGNNLFIGEENEMEINFWSTYIAGNGAKSFYFISGDGRKVQLTFNTDNTDATKIAGEVNNSSGIYQDRSYTIHEGLKIK